MAKHNALPKVTLSCISCGTGFTINGSKARAYGSRGGAVAKFCSVECARTMPVRHRVDAGETRTASCRTCGGECVQTRRIDISGRSRGWIGPKEFCSHACRAIHFNAIRGPGEGYLDKNGYRVLSVSGAQAFEHRHVMEQRLGRKLHPEETVHHINGHRDDNRDENLELWSSRHGRGQRVQDKIKFCLDFLKDYGISSNNNITYDFMSDVMGVA